MRNINICLTLYTSSTQWTVWVCTAPKFTAPTIKSVHLYSCNTGLTLLHTLFTFLVPVCSEGQLHFADQRPCLSIGHSIWSPFSYLLSTQLSLFMPKFSSYYSSTYNQEHSWLRTCYQNSSFISSTVRSKHEWALQFSHQTLSSSSPPREFTFSPYLLEPHNDCKHGVLRILSTQCTMHNTVHWSKSRA